MSGRDVAPTLIHAGRGWRRTAKLTDRRLVFFVGRLLLLYLLFAALWPMWGDAYRDAFVAAGQTLFGSFGRDGVVRFDRLEETKGFDVRILLWNRRTRAFLMILRDFRYTGYGLISLQAALVLATPLAWRRRLRALAWGLILIHLFVGLALWLLLLDTFSNGDSLAVFHLPGPLKFIVALSATHLSLFPTLPYVVPFMVWGLVTFRRGDWDLLLS